MAYPHSFSQARRDLWNQIYRDHFGEWVSVQVGVISYNGVDVFFPMMGQDYFIKCEDLQNKGVGLKKGDWIQARLAKASEADLSFGFSTHNACRTCTDGDGYGYSHAIGCPNARAYDDGGYGYNIGERPGRRDVEDREEIISLREKLNRAHEEVKSAGKDIEHKNDVLDRQSREISDLKNMKTGHEWQLKERLALIVEKDERMKAFEAKAIALREENELLTLNLKTVQGALKDVCERFALKEKDEQTVAEFVQEFKKNLPAPLPAGPSKLDLEWENEYKYKLMREQGWASLIKLFLFCITWLGTVVAVLTRGGF